MEAAWVAVAVLGKTRGNRGLASDIPTTNLEHYVPFIG